MHGDDVASTGVNTAGQTVTKVVEILLAILKHRQEAKHQKKMQRLSEAATSSQSSVLSGGEVTYRKLKEGGEITMLPSFAKSDYKEFLKQAKSLDIPVAAIQEQGKENTVSLYFNVTDKEAVNSIVQNIIRDKLSEPEQAGQSERMMTFDKNHAEGFQMYCAEHDIPVNFLEGKDGVKCIFNSAYEKQMEAAVKNFKKIHNELSKTSVKVENDDKGRPKIIVSDQEQGKQLSMNFCTKAKLERVLRERMNYGQVKSIEAANALTGNLSEQQQKYYLSGSRLLEHMDFYAKSIRLKNENLLTEDFDFAKMKFEGESLRLTISDKHGNIAVLTDREKDRAEAEKNIRQHLKLEDNETVNAILSKAERLGFVEQPKQTQYKEYQIERDSQTSFTVCGGGAAVRLDLTNKENAKKRLMDSFGMSEPKAEKVIGKAQKQTVSNNLLNKAREKVKNSADTLRNKKIERGSRK